MRKFGSNKSNPNPPWPNRQPVIVIPPGSNPASVGRPNDIVHNFKNMPLETTQGDAVLSAQEMVVNQAATQTENAFETREFPIMGFMPRGEIERNNLEPLAMQYENGNVGQNCLNYSVSQYLCQHSGKLAKVEFMFGEGTHIEKVGIIEGVGKDFLSIRELGTNTHIICSMKNIKFINIYDNNGENSFK